MLSLNEFKSVFPKCKQPEEFFNGVSILLPKYEINSSVRISAFLAQTGHESGGFSRIIENLNYSMMGLIKTWPTRFNSKNANMYARQPEKIANKVYANRLGNGDESSGDGWKYRGRGIIQITGKCNYIEFAKYKNMLLEEVPKYFETITGAIESGCWYWSKNKLNKYADVKDIKGMTKAINGGYIGLEERINLFNKILKLV